MTVGTAIADGTKGTAPANSLSINTANNRVNG
jgi:hypothetical protein